MIGRGQLDHDPAALSAGLPERHGGRLPGRRAVWHSPNLSCLLQLHQAHGALQAAGDQLLQAVIFHSDNLELSEQFDATTGYEKSVSDLSWSYASFLSAVRARTAI